MKFSEIPGGEVAGLGEEEERGGKGRRVDG